MSSVLAEISQLEEQLRLAELTPDPDFFEAVLADNAVMVSENGEPSFAKPLVIQSHQPGNGPKFTSVKMSKMNIVDHGSVAVVTCEGTYEGPNVNITLKFMRVWLKTRNRWQIVAGSISK